MASMSRNLLPFVAMAFLCSLFLELTFAKKYVEYPPMKQPYKPGPPSQDGPYHRGCEKAAGCRTSPPAVTGTPILYPDFPRTGRHGQPAPASPYDRGCSKSHQCRSRSPPATTNSYINPAYIKYPALVPIRGRHVPPPAPANPYDRGCSKLQRCRTSPPALTNAISNTGSGIARKLAPGN